MDKPDFWKVRLAEVKETVDAVKNGTVTTIAHSPNGHPVYAVSYGPEPDVPQSTWSGAMGAGAASTYRDGKSDPQRIVLVGACHGAEMEATAGLNNFIRIMETGRDYAGNDRSALKELGEKYRIVVIPCLNPDGRDNSPDHMIGRNQEEAVRINQGVWADGTTIGYPACKMYQPLDPSKCENVGGYPNSAGYNIMHDAAPGDLRTDEAKGLLKLVADEGADLVLHMHTHATAPAILPASHGVYDLHRKMTITYRRRLAEFFKERGLDVVDVPEKDPASTWLCPVNLSTMTSMASGAFSPVYEQPNGSCGYDVDFATMLEHSLAYVEMFLVWGRKETFSPRTQLMYTILDCDAASATYHEEKW